MDAVSCADCTVMMTGGRGLPLAAGTMVMIWGLRKARRPRIVIGLVFCFFLESASVSLSLSGRYLDA